MSQKSCSFLHGKSFAATLGWLWSFDLRVTALPKTLTGWVHVLALWPICTSARSMTGDEGNYSWRVFCLGMLPQSCMKVQQALNIFLELIIQTNIFRKCICLCIYRRPKSFKDANVFSGIILNLFRVQHVVEFDFKRPHKKTSYGGHRSSFS